MQAHASAGAPIKYTRESGGRRRLDSRSQWGDAHQGHNGKRGRREKRTSRKYKEQATEVAKGGQVAKRSSRSRSANDGRSTPIGVSTQGRAFEGKWNEAKGIPWQCCAEWRCGKLRGSGEHAHLSVDTSEGKVVDNDR
eukprot:6487985-Amphidinium_carterae.5